MKTKKLNLSTINLGAGPRSPMEWVCGYLREKNVRANEVLASSPLMDALLGANQLPGAGYEYRGIQHALAGLAVEERAEDVRELLVVAVAPEERGAAKQGGFKGKKFPRKKNREASQEEGVAERSPSERVGGGLEERVDTVGGFEPHTPVSLPTGSPSSIVPLGRTPSFADALTDFEHELTQAVFDHWAWQIKCKLAGKTPQYHLMPILYGPGGCGKSTFVRTLLKAIFPKWAFNDNARLSALNSPQNQEILASFYVNFFDELEGASKTDVSKLKNFLTGENVVSRKPGIGQLIITTQNVSTSIGATNDPVSEQIKDQKTMRRFFEIKCRDRMDWEKINTTDFRKWFLSIDHTKPSPLMAVDSRNYLFLDQVKSHCEGLVRTGIEEWLSGGVEHLKPNGKDGGSPFWASRVLYNDYVKYCKSQHLKPIHINAFTTELVSKRGFAWARDTWSRGVRRLREGEEHHDRRIIQRYPPRTHRLEWGEYQRSTGTEGFGLVSKPNPAYEKYVEKQNRLNPPETGDARSQTQE